MPCIEPDAKTARASIRDNLAVNGSEFVLRIFGRDTALNGETVARHVRLLLAAPARAVQLRTLRDEDLRAHKIDARDLLGDRVLDLDARVHLDEEPLVTIEIVEELDGPALS
jgi:hypothetical protein